MGLLGTLGKLQKNGADLYMQMSQYFAENAVVRAGWIEMARDLEQQAASLKSLPASFWNHLKPEEFIPKAEVEACSRDSASKSDRSLNGCFGAALDFEEPIILRAYVPLIRVLRTEARSDRGLDFYILVKAHVAHLTRLIEPYSADPSLVQRAHGLLERFEREVQQPAIPATAKQVKAVAKSPKRTRHTPAESSTPIGRVLRSTDTARPKRLVKKLGLSRRHAQR